MLRSLVLFRFLVFFFFFQAKRHVKKHLFSDTDHDTTDVSWLRESSRKSKPKVTKYSKQAPDNPKEVSAITSSMVKNNFSYVGIKSSSFIYTFSLRRNILFTPSFRETSKGQYQITEGEIKLLLK